MKKSILIWMMLSTVANSPGAPRAGDPFESGAPFSPAGRIDALVLGALRKHSIDPAPLCSDEVFLRRVYLDVIGTLPDPPAVEKFLRDGAPGKRAVLIDELLQREEFADYWAMKWCDLLRVKSEFPINLWPNAVQAYHHWIRDAMRQNKPYDQFVRELLTSSGSNFRVPPVNFYRAVQGREPAAMADAVALTFMGTRLEAGPAETRAHLAAFFSRISYKQTEEWKEEIVTQNPALAEPMDAILPDGTTVHIDPGKDPREVFADWLITPANPWFARNMVNRAWAWFLGRGIINEPDDIRPDNQPVNPELLTHLEREFVRSHYDLRALYRLILNSRTYQQSCIPLSTNPDAAALFACYGVRRLDAEVLIDALCGLFGGGEGYQSPIPEPFSYIPDNQRTIALADGSISSQFLEMFGRPARDTGLESERNNQPTDAQRLHLLNSSHIQTKIDRSPRLRRWIDMARKNPRGAIRLAYVNILSREPTQQEQDAAAKYFKSDGLRLDQAVSDLAWALINSKEFLYRH